MADVPDNQKGVVNRAIPGGRCEVIRYVGSYNKTGEIAYCLY
ncbi:MAG: hypothetical protein ACYC9S_08330 [Leptospirales bacterium]